jgi:hypothetical protein
LIGNGEFEGVSKRRSYQIYIVSKHVRLLKGKGRVDGLHADAIVTDDIPNAITSSGDGSEPEHPQRGIPAV